MYRPKKKAQVDAKKRLSILSIGIIFVISSITTYAVRNQLFYHIDVLIFLFATLAIYYGVLIGLVDYIMATYCLIRFPSFRIKSMRK